MEDEDDQIEYLVSEGAMGDLFFSQGKYTLGHEAKEKEREGTGQDKTVDLEPLWMHGWRMEDGGCEERVSPCDRGCRGRRKEANHLKLTLT